jgi:hypothetical protein
MKKPINKFALAIWAAAFALALMDVFQTWSIYNNLSAVSREVSESPLVLQSVVQAATGFLFQIGMLAGIGALIEVADRIRWRLDNSN